ncbi:MULTISPECIES: hypothetical protein [Pseudomonas]|jgi:hypothetical protein|uniref:hypothetical protein n=1 Tax=Pseudomonas TaxID=286 RepID=UPI001AAE70C7|nr:MULTISPECIES: hypothetical protein [Pseudomonas]MBO2891193.1 hypothetical protein [Pseudomonas asiatica]MCE0938162.1 hypothetical protein [Pseudomonas kurunegalensis]
MKSLELLAWVAGLLGFGLLVAGVAMLNVPSAFVVAGIGLLLWAYLADKAAAAPAPTHEGGG